MLRLASAPSGPPPVPSRGGEWENRPRSADIIEVERQIAELVDRSTKDLRVAWRELHRTGPPQGLSRDLLIRALAHRLQEQAHGRTSRAQRRRLQRLAREFEKGSGSEFSDDEREAGDVPTGPREIRDQA